MELGHCFPDAERKIRALMTCTAVVGVPILQYTATRNGPPFHCKSPEFHESWLVIWRLQKQCKNDAKTMPTPADQFVCTQERAKSRQRLAPFHSKRYQFDTANGPRIASINHPIFSLFRQYLPTFRLRVLHSATPYANCRVLPFRQPVLIGWGSQTCHYERAKTDDSSPAVRASFHRFTDTVRVPHLAVLRKTVSSLHVSTCVFTYAVGYTLLFSVFTSVRFAVFHFFFSGLDRPV